MTDLMYLIVGAVIGLIVGVIIFFLLPYRSLRNVAGRLRADLAEEQSKNNELQGAVLTQQTTAYQTRQAMLAQQKRFEDDMSQAGEQRSRLEQECIELKSRAEREQQNHLQEVTRLRDLGTRLEEDKTALQKQFSQDRVEWDRQIQSFLLQNAQTEEQLRGWQRDKTQLSARLEEQQEAWEGERLEMQIQINTLEDSLTLYKARANQNLSADSLELAEKLKMEAAAEFNQRRAAWDEERQNLRQQLEHLQAEASDRAKSGEPLSQPGNWRAEKQTLLQQLDQAHQARRDLEEKMAVRDRQAEQVRSALEAEIEQLMERFLRLHSERSS